MRVRGTRQVSDDGTTVALDYAIEPGPITELVIEGHPLEPSLQEDIREAWRRTIFDRFLLEDIRHAHHRDTCSKRTSSAARSTRWSRSRRRSASRSVSPSRPARRSTRARCATPATRAFDADRLDAVIDDAGLDVDGWLDPRRVAEALENFYRSRRLSVGHGQGRTSRRSSGSVGVLPVTIDEGPRFVIGDGDVSRRQPAAPAGGRRRRAARTGRAVRHRRDRRRARAHRGASTRSEGFNAVQIEVDTGARSRRARTVAVSFAVLEGLQQILREVTTEGATRTRDGRRSGGRCGCASGQPVNLGDWSQARKRLYDTNVFRQVDIEPVPMEPTTEDSAAGIQPVRAVVRVVEYPVWRLRYGTAAQRRARPTSRIRDGDTRLQTPRCARRSAESESVRPCRSPPASPGATSAIGRPAASSRRTARSSACRFDRAGSSSRRASASCHRRVQRRSTSASASSAEQRWRPFRTVGSDLELSLRAHAHVRSRTPAPDDPLPLDIVVKVSKLNAGDGTSIAATIPPIPTRGWFSSANWEQAVAAARIGLRQRQAARCSSRSIADSGASSLAGRAQVGHRLRRGGADRLGTLPPRRRDDGARLRRGHPRPARRRSGSRGGDALLAFNARAALPGARLGAGRDVRRRRQRLRGARATSRSAISPWVTASACGWRRRSRCCASTSAFRPAPSHPIAAPISSSSGRWYFGIGHIF